MKSLSKEDIMFMDKYLKNSGIKHLDIRLEMIDHVATAIEDEIKKGDSRDFYYIFKDYMVRNKRRLLNNNKKLCRTIEIKLLKRILKTMLQWPCITFFIIVGYGINFLSTSYNSETLTHWFNAVPLIGYVIFGIVYFIVLSYYKLDRFSALERLSFIFAILFNVFIFSFNLAQLKYMDNYIISIISSLALTLLLAMFMVIRNVIKDYRKQFEVI